MPDNQNTTQNPISEENSIPSSPQGPTEPALENTVYSEPSDAPSEAPESSPNDFLVKSNDIPLPDSTPTEAEKESKTEEKPRENESVSEPQPQANQPTAEIQPPKTATEPSTAQIPGNKPLTPGSEPIKQEPVFSPGSSEVKQEVKPEPVIVPVPIIIPPKNSIRELLNKAKNAIQFRKRKKLDRVMTLFSSFHKIGA